MYGHEKRVFISVNLYLAIKFENSKRKTFEIIKFPSQIV